VPPFRAPAANADLVALETSDAVHLFVDRARLVRPNFSPDVDDFGLIAEISSQVDGLPLAIELAAARIRVLPLAAIRDRLGRRLDALVGGPANAPSRQRSLRAAIDWSHDLLDEGGRALFRRLATFVGGWTLEAAEAIAGQQPVGETEEGLDRLVEQSLVQASAADGEPRFTMLPTIGEYAAERLEASGESMAITSRHASFFRELAELGSRQFETPAGDLWLDRMESDLDNIRTAIERSVAGDDLPTAMRIAAALRSFWLRRNHSAEGLRTLVSLVEQAGGTQTPEVAAAASAATAIATWLGDYETGRRLGALGVAAFREVGDRRGLADALGSFAFSLIEVDPQTALALILESSEMYRELEDVRGQGQGLLARATAQFGLGRLLDVRESLEESIALSHEAGDLYFEIFSRLFIGRVRLLMGEIPEGLAEYRTVLSTSQELDLRLGIAATLDYFGEIAIWLGDLPTAVHFGAAAARIKEELGGGIPPRMGGALDPLEVGQSRLSPEEFNRHVVLGRTGAIDMIVAEALAMPAPKSIPAARPSAPA
jgi:hypothetical protein